MILFSNSVKSRFNVDPKIAYNYLHRLRQIFDINFIYENNPCIKNWLSNRSIVSHLFTVNSARIFQSWQESQYAFVSLFLVDFYLFPLSRYIHLRLSLGGSKSGIRVFSWKTLSRQIGNQFHTYVLQANELIYFLPYFLSNDMSWRERRGEIATCQSHRSN